MSREGWREGLVILAQNTSVRMLSCRHGEGQSGLLCPVRVTGRQMLPRFSLA